MAGFPNGGGGTALALLKANNLSDVASVPTSRANLGVNSMPSGWQTVNASTIDAAGDAAVMVSVATGDLYLQGGNAGGNQFFLDLEADNGDLTMMRPDHGLARVHVDAAGAQLVLQPRDGVQSEPLISLLTDANQALFRVDVDGSINTVATDGATLMKLSVTNLGVASWAPA